MRAVRSEDLQDRSKGWWLWVDLSKSDCVGRYSRTASLDEMSTPAVLTSNFNKLRMTQNMDKASKRKDMYKYKIKKEAPSEPIPIGDNLEACNTFETAAKEGKELTRPQTAGKGKNGKEPVIAAKETSQEGGDSVKAFPGTDEQTAEDRLTTYGDEGFYDDEQPQPKTTVIEEVKELLRKSEAQRAEMEEMRQAELCRLAQAQRPRKRLWAGVLVWSMTFLSALAFYFALFSYSYKLEPVYSYVMLTLGWRQELPPPPPSVTDQILDMFSRINLKLYDLHMSLLEKISFPLFQNKL